MMSPASRTLIKSVESVEMKCFSMGACPATCSCSDWGKRDELGPEDDPPQPIWMPCACEGSAIVLWLGDFWYN